MFIYPYKLGSKSVKSLKGALVGEGINAKIIRLENSNFKGSDDKLVINWGNSSPNEQVERCKVLNEPAKVKIASNKLDFFRAVEGACRIPEYTEAKDQAKQWSEAGAAVVVREKLTGHSGEGIVILENPLEFESYNHSRAKLYVKYVPKKQEYRVHVVGLEPILVQRKARRNDFPDELVNWKVRSHENGFIFARNEDKAIPDDVVTQAKDAIEAIGLDFGAVDVVWNEYRQEATVLEVNSAPGLEGTTTDDYVGALMAYAKLAEDLKQGARPMPKKKRGSGGQWNQIYIGNVALDGVPQEEF